MGGKNTTTHLKPCSSYNTTVGTLRLNAQALSSSLSPGTVASFCPKRPASISSRREGPLSKALPILGRVKMLMRDISGIPWLIKVRVKVKGWLELCKVRSGRGQLYVPTDIKLPDQPGGVMAAAELY